MNIHYVTAVILVIACSLQVIYTVEPIYANVYYNKITGKYNVQLGDVDHNAVAYANYTPSYYEDGWDYLTVSSYIGDDVIYSDVQKSYAMGYIEGYLTQERIWDFYRNMVASHFATSDFVMPDNTREFLIENFKFIQDKCAELKDSDPYWAHINSIYYQLQGLVDGYNNKASVSQRINFIEFQVMTAFGDIGELSYWKTTQYRPKYEEMSSREIADYFDEHMHCSALIKVAADFSDVYFGHNTWFTFNHMNRMFKEYRYKSNTDPTRNYVVAFSSYPAVLSSNDDFYITDQDLYVMETTNNIFDTTLYDLLTPQCVLTWMRAVVCNRLSTNGKEWVEHFSRYNSGTYNNQYMVMDMKKIDTTLKVIEDEAFVIIEQIPGQFRVHDQSNYLRKGYWPSVNIPFTAEIREISGYNTYLKEHPDLIPKFDYYQCARMSIFRRDAYSVNSVDGYKHMLLYNDYKNDPLSRGSPAYAIAARKDLEEGAFSCSGMIDVKTASINDVKGKKGKKIHIISGPTHNDYIEPFEWSKITCNGKEPNKFKHYGQNEKWEFPWKEYITTLF